MFAANLSHFQPALRLLGRVGEDELAALKPGFA